MKALCRDKDCPFKDNCKRYKPGEVGYYFTKSPRHGCICNFYDAIERTAPEGVKRGTT